MADRPSHRAGTIGGARVLVGHRVQRGRGRQPDCAWAAWSICLGIPPHVHHRAASAPCDRDRVGAHSRHSTGRPRTDAGGAPVDRWRAGHDPWPRHHQQDGLHGLRAGGVAGVGAGRWRSVDRVCQATECLTNRERSRRPPGRRGDERAPCRHRRGNGRVASSHRGECQREGPPGLFLQRAGCRWTLGRQRTAPSRASGFDGRMRESGDEGILARATRSP